MLETRALISLPILFVQIAVATPEVSLGDTFKQCLISYTPGNLGRCMGVATISKLQSWDSSPEFDLIDGVTLTKDGQEYREAYNFIDGDPSSFRSIMDTFSGVFSRRNLQMNMGFLYPGLSMRLSPSLNPGGQLEFVLDPHREAVNVHSLKEAGTGRLLARQFLLPFLLGFKFNVVSILPIVFGILALLAKKAVIISKIALVVTSAIGLACLIFGQGNQQYQQQYYNPSYHHGGLGGGLHGYNRYQDVEYDSSYYRRMPENTSDQLHLHDKVSTEESRESQANGRNFAWNEDEKKSILKSVAKR